MSAGGRPERPAPHWWRLGHRRDAADRRKSPAGGEASRPQPSNLLLDTTALAGVLILAGFLGWLRRFQMNPDGISYLDIADAYFQGAWAEALNAYWSPLYSWILGLHFCLLHPSPYWEFAAAKLANGTIFLAAFFSFRFLLDELILYRHSKRSSCNTVAFSDSSLRILGYTIFVWISLKFFSLHVVSPDLLLACFVYLASGLLLRMARGRRGVLVYGALGVVCGFGYLAKTAFFPLTGVLLFCSLLCCKPVRTEWFKPLIAAAAFALVAMPFVARISMSTGHLTFGETGKLNYIKYVAHEECRLDYPRAGTYKVGGSGRVIHRQPKVCEFAAPPAETYPPHYDPSDWSDGLATAFSPALQFQACLHNSARLLTVFLLCGSMVFPLALLLGMTFKAGVSWGEIKTYAIVLPPCLAAMAMYGMVLLLSRYVAHFLAVVLLCGFGFVHLGRCEKNVRLLRRCALLTVGITAALIVIHCVLVAALRRTDVHHHWQVANQLQQSGLSPGDRVCVVGSGHREFWARLARVQIAAEIEDRQDFQAASKLQRQEVYTALRKAGITMVVTPAASECLPDEGWRNLPDGRYAALDLRRR